MDARAPGAADQLGLRGLRRGDAPPRRSGDRAAGRLPLPGPGWDEMDWSGLDTTGLSYVVVEEIEGGMVGLAVSDWPTTDDKGRLRFGSEPVQAALELVELERFLDLHRQPSRPLRVGDVFAARTGRRPRPGGWIEPPVHDVTADAREAAKIAFYAAVAPVPSRRKRWQHRAQSRPTTSRPGLPRRRRARGSRLLPRQRRRGDAQLIVLPTEPDGRRRALVVDVGSRRKLPHWSSH